MYHTLYTFCTLFPCVDFLGNQTESRLLPFHSILNHDAFFLIWNADGEGSADSGEMRGDERDEPSLRQGLDGETVAGDGRRREVLRGAGEGDSGIDRIRKGIGSVHDTLQGRSERPNRGALAVGFGSHGSR